MKIKAGFNDKETEIKISTQDNGSIELWIEETGNDVNAGRATLSYMTPAELHDLFLEVQQAGKDLFN